MRRAEKAQVGELLGLLGQTHSKIQSALGAGRRGEAAGLLGQCQEIGIGIGERIEAAEGEGSVTVRLLESYCETVFQIYEAVRGMDDSAPCRMSDGERRGQAGWISSLTEAFSQIEDSVEKDIPVRTEVVFLPYKAAMWDSLESIWKAADEDPDCDAYVIPIPYYDRRPDGSLGEEHYEGDLYPAYVPVTGYQEYDLAVRRPDRIFIHNPYDEHNLVTSVHPFFYSKNLKRYTKELVYVPYFILNEIDPSDKRAIKGIEHLCVVPAVIYADKVIVQSKAMRQIYIDLMMENMQTDKIPRAYWERKIAGLGSPKLDKVRSTRKEELELPEEWLKIIRRADGSWKKVIFYNTSVWAILRYEEKMLAKMRDVFRIFWEERDEVALLWRPHPLMQATIKSLKPELQEGYERIVKAYREQGWGIYDDTPDVDRAVMVCDAYYGDGSSVVKLCEGAGRPIMIQEHEIGTLR